MCAPSYHQQTYQGVLILIWNHGSPQCFYWQVSYILSKKLFLGAAKVVFITSELYTVALHHQILNRSFVFLRRIDGGKEASEEDVLGCVTSFWSMARTHMTPFPQWWGFHPALKDCHWRLTAWPNMEEVGPEKQKTAVAEPGYWFTSREVSSTGRAEK